MNKQKLYLADGTGRPADFAATGTFSLADKNQLITVAGEYSGCRRSGKNMLCGFASNRTDRYEPWRQFRELLAKTGVGWKSDKVRAAGTSESKMEFANESAAEQACAIGNSIIDMGRWLRSQPDYTIDEAYAGGGKLTKFGSVSYLIPYDTVRAELNRLEAESNAASEKKAAEDRKATEVLKTETADQKRVRLVAQLKSGGLQALLWAGVAVVAAAVVYGVVAIVKKTKKK